MAFSTATETRALEIGSNAVQFRLQLDLHQTREKVRGRSLISEHFAHIHVLNAGLVPGHQDVLIEADAVELVAEARHARADP